MNPTTTRATDTTSSSSKPPILIRIKRQDSPDQASRWEEFAVPYRANMNIISCLQWIAAHPTTALLVVEVAESSLAQDRLTKGPMYAAAGIPGYWLVNLRERCVEVHRRPVRAERRYAETRIARVEDVLDVAALPSSSIRVQDILPPQPSPDAR